MTENRYARRRSPPLFRRSYPYQRTHLGDHVDLAVYLVIVLVGLAVAALFLVAPGG